jgi:MFS family permease
MRGYFIVVSVWWVVDADLSPLQLVLLGTALELSVLLGEVPTGVVADTFSRKWSIVISQLVMGVGIIVSGLTTSFVPLVVSQVLWGLGWTFTSGADIAWITDELAHAGREGEVNRIIAATARWKQIGGIVGMIALGLLGWIVSVDGAIVLAGATFILLGIAVAVVFPEHGFTRSTEDHLATSLRIFRSGLSLARRDRQILLVLAATLLLNSGAEAIDRLFFRHLVDLGLPDNPDPVVWITALTVVGSLAGALALRFVEARIEGNGAPRRLYVASVGLAVIGTLVMAAAPEVLSGLAGTFVTRGIAWAVIPVVAATWVNQRATSDVRATVQSFLGQAESIGEISGGITLGAAAQASGIPLAFTLSASLFALAALLVWRSPAGRRAPVVGSTGHVP